MRQNEVYASLIVSIRCFGCADLTVHIVHRMKKLSVQEVRTIRDLGERARVCETLPELQGVMYEGINRLVGCDSGVCFDSTNTPFGWRFVRGQAFGVTDSDLRRWCQDYQARDPFVLQLSRLFKCGGRRIFTSSDIRASVRYEDDAFCNEFLKPQSIYHVMTIGLDKANLPDGVPGGMIGLHRSKRCSPFAEADVVRVATLLPYYLQAMQRVQIKDMAIERQSIIEVLSSEPPLLGIMILDHDCVPTYVDEEVSDLLGFPEPIKGDAPETVSHEVTQAIQSICRDMLARHETSDRIPNYRTVRFSTRFHRETTCRIHIRVEEAGRVQFILCLLHDGHDVDQSAAKRLNLTMREIEVAHLVAKGMTNPQIARLLGISVRTVQNHLRAMYSKADVHNRTGLAAMLLRSVPLPDPGRYDGWRGARR
ncbi:MAG: helix-turn-helix transcriptional regulator [Bryobacterales bacterium]|nr:helix-turn-helix transcriptional regulator [Bryobacterales bacterium]